MMPDMRRFLAAIVVAAMTLAALPSQAADNDIVLSRFGSCEGGDGDCSSVNKDTEGFENLTRDLGQVFAPRFINGSDTLGEAGFAFNMMMSGSIIPHTEDYWQTAVEDGDPDQMLTTAHLQMRKGLPFSFEVGGEMSYLLNSEMFNMGGHLQWALHEGFYYFPDIAVRGTINNVMGTSALNLFSAGWDISTSKEFAIAGTASVTPYVGYQQLHIIASSRVLNAHPQDPRPPQEGDNGGQTFSPEFVFDQNETAVNRFFVGTEFDVWVLNLAAEGVLSDDVYQFTVGGGVDF
ncbi:MAG: hypothetical protein ACOCV2_04875 [Persicimonas sp.]